MNQRSAPRAALLAALLLGAGPAGSAGPAGNASEVRLDVVKYGGLVDAVRAHKGKIVVVDVWATTCIPCRQEFHNLVELHHNGASRGVVCMSVSVDPAARKEAALKFLQSQGAAFANFLLDEDPSLWTKRWGIETIPTVFVFDRDGRRAGKFTGDDFNYDAVKDLVRRLLVSSP
jgi:thiol-disulfide isomerase/thioredoxin